MKMPSVKTPFLSGIAFFLTVCALSVGYALTHTVPVQTASGGSTLSSSEWNKIVSNLSALDEQAAGFESAEIPLTQITSMVKTASHGLGTRPKRWNAVLRCKTAEA